MCPSKTPLAAIKGLAFDMFGTTVDWRTSVVQELTLRAHRKQAGAIPDSLKERLQSLAEQDWGRFAQEWRNSYMDFVKAFDADRDAWKTIDEHHYEGLVRLLDSWGLCGLYTESEMESLSLVWHRLSPWPDAVGGLARLRERGFKLMTLSNGNEELVRDLVDFGAMEFDALFCAESFGLYKPHPGTYLGVVREMGLEPSQVAMVACHMKDLKGARACGLRTIYVERPLEEDMDKNGDEFNEARNWVDLWVGEHEAGFDTMAERLLDFVQ
ncbi:hypothetical protein EsDP_00001900 [Epichloe bromicola]|uniref:Haloacid dehalogenase n=1 Tax=Epichloe bromicola TaxID=79588 RepID=A0ABQ0CJ71_9HYPO